jgi:uncharacterized protein YukE
MKEPAALPPFSQDWIGGDIRGLSSFAGTMYDYAQKIGNVAAALDKQVTRIIGDAHWKGTAEQAFLTAWDKDTVAAQKLSQFASAVGQDVDDLALNLAMIEHKLEIAASTLHVKVSVKNGVLELNGARQQVTEFGNYITENVTAAQNERNQAAAAISGECHELTSAWKHTSVTFAEGVLMSAAGGAIINIAGNPTAIVESGEAAWALYDAGVIGGTEALATVAGPLLGTAAVGAAVGVAAVGVGDFVTHFGENLGSEIHSKGVIDGLGADAGHSAMQTGDDFRHVWDSIF